MLEAQKPPAAINGCERPRLFLHQQAEGDGKKAYSKRFSCKSPIPRKKQSSRSSTHVVFVYFTNLAEKLLHSNFFLAQSHLFCTPTAVLHLLGRHHHKQFFRTPASFKVCSNKPRIAIMPGLFSRKVCSHIGPDLPLRYKILTPRNAMTIRDLPNTRKPTLLLLSSSPVLKV